MLSNLKNGQLSKKVYITQKKKKICSEILNVLWDEGFILGYKNHPQISDALIIFLKYNRHEPCIKIIKSVSKPSNRLYFSVKQLWKIESSSGLIIFTTNKGVFTTKKCLQYNLGGEPLIFLK